LLHVRTNNACEEGLEIGSFVVFEVAFLVPRKSCRYRLERGMGERAAWLRSEGCERLLRAGHVIEVGIGAEEFEIERLMGRTIRTALCCEK